MSKHAKTLVCLVAATLVLAGCGSKKTVSAETYMTGLCTEIGDWLHAVQARSGEIGNELTPGMGPADGKKVLAGFLDDVIALSQKAVDGIEAKGVPDVENGDQIAAALKGAFEQAKGIFQDARAKVDDLPTDDPAAFQRAATDLGSSIQKASNRIGSSLGTVKSPELVQAAKTKACAERGF